MNETYKLTSDKSISKKYSYINKKEKADLKRLFKILTLFAIIFCIISCEEEKTPEKVFYSSKTTGLAQKVTDFDLGIKFSPPKEWDLRSTEISNRVENKGGYQGIQGEFIYSPSYVYFDDSTTSVLSLGKVIPPDSLIGREGLLNLYSQILASKKSTDSNYEIDQFIKDGIKFTQFSIDRGSIISKRLVFQNKFKDIIQFEYTSKATQFKTEFEKIKQSIGSITLL